MEEERLQSSEAAPGELHFTITGMSCAACAARIERSLRGMDGVEEATVSFPLRRAWVQLSLGEAAGAASGGERIVQKIKQLGFAAESGDSVSSALHREHRLLRLKAFAAVLFTLPLLAGMTEHVAWLHVVREALPELLFNQWLQLGLATIVQFLIGMSFYFGAFHALRQRSANMDVLVAIGTSAAYFYSHYAIFRNAAAGGASHYPLYFETSAVVIAVVLLGKYVEASASRRAGRQADGFQELLARQAQVEKSGVVKQIRAELVREGDVVVVDAGDRFPVDGTVAEGETTTDEALLTGESAPQEKKEGDPVWAGTRNNGAAVKVYASAVGRATMVSRIGALVRKGQRSKSSLQYQVDRAASWFVPTILAIATLTWLLWAFYIDPFNWERAMLCAIAVLLASCPCALGLAAPLSLVIASGKLADRGIVAKDASAIERLAAIETIVLDKTGTLTEGKLKVSFVRPITEGRTSILRLVAALETESVHPVAHAVRQEAKRAGIGEGALSSGAGVEGLRHIAGGGVEGMLNGQRCLFGNAQFIAGNHCEISEAAREAAIARERLGETVLYAVRGERCVGVIGFSDHLKRSAGRMIAELRMMRISPIMATGDYEAGAFAAARLAGIAKVRSSLLPEDKLELVESIKRRGRGVAMAGDGWNDAPALAAADVGIAMGNGTEAALEAGHLTVVGSRLMAIPEAVAISRLAIRNIRQNLSFAFIYNLLIVPFAVAGLLQPWMAGTAMALSSMSVVGNALRLRRKLGRSVERSV